MERKEAIERGKVAWLYSVRWAFVTPDPISGPACRQHLPCLLRKWRSGPRKPGLFLSASADES